MRTVAIIPLLFPLIALADENDAAKTDMALFQGNWQLISMVRDGQKESEEEVKKIDLTIRDNTFVLRKDGKVVSEGTFALDPAKNPKEVTETITSGRNKGKAFQAIYEIDDKQHRICFAAPGKKRPTTFSSDPGSGQVFQVWRKQRPKHVTNGIGMKFVWIPAGVFIMGSPKEEQYRRDDEVQHKVTLTKGFYMGVHTVTNEQWKAIMGSTSRGFTGEANVPVDDETWDHCQTFIEKLRDKDKKPYRLPTEAEWEYSCRAGTTTPFHFGQTISTDQANYAGEYIYGSGQKGVSRRTTTPMGSFPPNVWGLYDMHGNVWQWCQDWLGDYPKRDVADPQGPINGNLRALRGGSFNNPPDLCRSAFRFWYRTGLGGTNGTRRNSGGFRVCFFPD